MAITHSKLKIINDALRLVGSYHLESDDTTSATYEITDRAFDYAVNTVFSENVFQFNTKRVLSTGVATSTLADADKPADYWSYRHELQTGGPFRDLKFNLLLKVTNKEGNCLLNWVLDGSRVDDTSSTAYADIPYLFTEEETVHIYYSFVPNLDESEGNRGDSPSGMPSYLARIITLHMAQSMAVELSGSENRQVTLFAQYTQALRRARVLEGRSSPAQSYINEGNSRILDSHFRYGKVQ